VFFLFFGFALLYVVYVKELVTFNEPTITYACVFNKASGLVSTILLMDLNYTYE